MAKESARGNAERDSRVSRTEENAEVSRAGSAMLAERPSGSWIMDARGPAGVGWG